MRSAIFLLACATTLGAGEDRLATIRRDLQQLSVDPTQTYRVRELEIVKGGAKFYLSEGVLAFATPVDGHRLAAVFTTDSVEAGDAEVISLPPSSAERASLARFAKTPNLDEHFTAALFFFADNTAEDLLRQIHEHPLHPAPDLGREIGSHFDDLLRRSANEIQVRLAQSILDRHSASNSFFYGMLSGRTLGPMDFIFQPDQPDALVFGRIANRQASKMPDQGSFFQIWSAFRTKNLAENKPIYRMSDYRLETKIHTDLSMSAVADFDYQVDSDDGGVITLSMTPRLRATSATIDGQRAGILLHDSARTEDMRGAITFLLVSANELQTGSHHRVKIEYEGTVIRRSSDGGYFVDDRNAWYPFVTPMLTVFDLMFHSPENLRLVASGNVVSEDVANGQRTVHRRTAKAEALAGFNLGEFQITTAEREGYRIEICSNPQMTVQPNLVDESAQILRHFTERWGPLSGRNIAVTPIEGYFGQGFPGLIYLSSMSYLEAKDRPHVLQSASLDSFFSQLLLPHEMAHQWWGNVVTPVDYRSNWIVEAMSNYSALQYLEQAKGRTAMEDILATYRADLTTPLAHGELVDSYGPVTFDQRLENNFGSGIWHDILYEKGTWIFHMLRERMGDAAFHDFQLRVLKDFSARPISNEDLRQEAAGFVPVGQPDRQLTAFFDTWVYDTGIPVLSVKDGNLLLSDVPDSYTVDVPLVCGAKVSWLRINSGEVPMPAKNCELPSVGAFLFKKE